MDDSAHERILKHFGYEAVAAFFENVDVASVLDEKYFVENVS